MTFERLIRFHSEDGQCLFGEPLISSPEELQEHLEKGVLRARVLQGLDKGTWLDFSNAKPHSPEEIVFVKRLVGPLDPEHVPIIRCIGLNYIKHSKLRIRKYPQVSFGLLTNGASN